MSSSSTPTTTVIAEPGHAARPHAALAIQVDAASIVAATRPTEQEVHQRDGQVAPTARSVAIDWARRRQRFP